jgi:hypothetical protein
VKRDLCVYERVFVCVWSFVAHEHADLFNL